jgi:hypothetical protein
MVGSKTDRQKPYAGRFRDRKTPCGRFLARQVDNILMLVGSETETRCGRFRDR